MNTRGHNTRGHSADLIILDEATVATDDTTASAAGGDAETQIVAAATTVAADGPQAWALDEDDTAIMADRRPWRDAWRIAAAVVIVGVALAAAAIMFWPRHHHNAATPPAPAPVPAESLKTAAPAAPVGPDGTYRIDADMSADTFSGKSTPAHYTGISTTWWAFHTSCANNVCRVVAVQLKESDHATAVGDVDTLGYRNGRWEDLSPVTIALHCDNGTSQDMSVAWWFATVGPDGVLRGGTAETAETDGCVVKGDAVQTPMVGARTGPVPPGVLVP
jgi:serine/threonine-protein kinase